MADITVDDVNTAISTILSNGQSYRIMDREYTFADLAELRRLRKELQAEADSAGCFKPVRFVSP